MKIRLLQVSDGTTTVILVDRHGDQAELDHVPYDATDDPEYLARVRVSNMLKELARKLRVGEIEIEKSKS